MATSTENLPFQGKVFVRGEDGYAEHCYQYATSTHAQDGSMQPALIIYAKNDDDVIAAIKYATDNGLAIAVRTGGHQYSGASSTSGNNIQLDLSETYRDFDWNEDTGLLRTGISWALGEFNEMLGQKGLFVPHGQCTHVHLGGHAQSGGYGQLARSFGLLADYIRGFEIITADGKKQTVTSESNKDLFWAVLGGSPGNYGVLTHVIVAPQQDKNHPKSRGLKVVYPYSTERLKRLLDVMVEMADDKNFPADFDYSLTVLSPAQVLIPHLFPGIDEDMRRQHANLYGHDGLPAWPAGIMVYLQWANLGGADQVYDPGFFAKIKEAAGIHHLAYFESMLTAPFRSVFDYDYFLDDAHTTPMSEMTKAWIFINVREFELPYEKRTYLTNSKTLARDGWAEWVTGRMDVIQRGDMPGCKLSAQLQNFGGPKSAYTRNGASQTTAHSWRSDSTISFTIDCFHEPQPGPRQAALDWQHQNDVEGILHDHIFCTEDRRLLWGSYGDRDMSNVWQTYYDSPEKYQRLCEIKNQVDPQGIFSANTFCVGGGRKPQATPVPGVVWDDKSFVAAFKERFDAFRASE